MGRVWAAGAVLVPAAATVAPLWVVAGQAAGEAPCYAQMVAGHSGHFTYGWRVWDGVLAFPEAVAETITGQALGTLG